MSTQKSTISVAMIVKNEGQDLAQCLSSVKDWVDEIVILDSGSTDNTEQIAREYGAKFYRNTDWQGFGKQRQLAQQYVTSDYVLWLDADERVTTELRQSIEAVLQNNKPNTLYKVSRLSRALGREIHHSGWYPGYVVRLYKTDYAKYDDAQVHEKVACPAGAKVEKLKGDLLHFTYKNIHHYLLKSTQYAKAWVEQREQQGKRATVLDAFVHAIGCFFKMYILRAGFLDGKQGLILALLSTHYTFVKYLDLWERTQNKDNL